MLAFTIDITSKSTFDFTDNSDYTGLTVTDTSLDIFPPSPKIDNSEFETIALYSDSDPSLPVGANLGDSASIDLVALGVDLSLIDGIYKFVYTITLDDLSTQTATIYVVNDLDIKQCKKNLIISIMNDEGADKCRSCEATIIDSILSSVNVEADAGNYKSAEELFDYLKRKCNLCTNC